MYRCCISFHGIWCLVIPQTRRQCFDGERMQQVLECARHMRREMFPGKSLKEVSERAFSADGIANQQREKIDGFIASEASTHQTHLMPKDLKQSPCCQVLGNDHHLGEPGRHPGTVNRRGLHLNTHGLRNEVVAGSE